MKKIQNSKFKIQNFFQRFYWIIGNSKLPACRRGREIRNSQRSWGGFTLIELIIAMSIMGLLVGAGAVSYRDFNRRQLLRSAALNVKNTFRDIQSKAINGQKPVGVICTTLLGYEVSFTAQSVQWRAQCSNGFGPTESYILPSRITVVQQPPPVVFQVLDRGISQVTTVALGGFDKVYEMTITQTGEIQDSDIISNWSPRPTQAGNQAPAAVVSPTLPPVPDVVPTAQPTAAPTPQPTPTPTQTCFWGRYFCR